MIEMSCICGVVEFLNLKKIDINKTITNAIDSGLDTLSRQDSRHDTTFQVQIQIECTNFVEKIGKL